MLGVCGVCRQRSVSLWGLSTAVCEFVGSVDSGLGVNTQHHVSFPLVDVHAALLVVSPRHCGLVFVAPLAVYTQPICHLVGA